MPKIGKVDTIKLDPDFVRELEQAVKQHAGGYGHWTPEMDACILEWMPRMTCKQFAALFIKQFGAKSASSLHRRYTCLKRKKAETNR